MPGKTPGWVCDDDDVDETERTEEELEAMSENATRSRAEEDARIQLMLEEESERRAGLSTRRRAATEPDVEPVEPNVEPVEPPMEPEPAVRTSIPRFSTFGSSPAASMEPPPPEPPPPPAASSLPDSCPQPLLGNDLAVRVAQLEEANRQLAEQLQALPQLMLDAIQRAKGAQPPAAPPAGAPLAMSMPRAAAQADPSANLPAVQPRGGGPAAMDMLQGVLSIGQQLGIIGGPPQAANPADDFLAKMAQYMQIANGFEDLTIKKIMNLTTTLGRMSRAMAGFANLANGSDAPGAAAGAAGAAGSFDAFVAPANADTKGA